jgi:multidrug resistance efflux pump
VNAKADWEESKRNYLKDQREYKMAISTITSTRIQINELEKRIQELLIQEQNANKDLLADIEAAMNQLTERLKLWEQSYMLKAPFDGQIAFFKYWSDNQYLKQGEEILTVISGSKEYLVKATVPVTNSGKIKTGQRVNIKLDNFPYQEFGSIRGRISNISLLPKENNYLITIQLPDSLVSSYRKKIAFKQEMTGQAEIITEDLRLLDRFFYRIRSLTGN